MKGKIKYVELGSIAEEVGIESGDILVAINHKPVLDIMDYLYYRDDDSLLLTVQKPDGQLWDIDIEKDYDESLGIVFENPIIDCAQSCTNQCLFCFIDQMPAGMRETLYFKDDDSRLSFMMGNFVTLTNLNDQVFQRIIDYRISPINISVHTVDADLRIKMLGNRFAGKIKERLIALKEAGIEMNGQVVLCPGYNDGTYLDETIDFLSQCYPYMHSMAVVPVGLTDFRDGLAQLTPVDQAIASEVLSQIEGWQQKLLKQIGTRFVFAADEFFLRANQPIATSDYYEGYIQIENGVGLIRQFEDAALQALTAINKIDTSRAYYVLTSTDALQMMRRIADKLYQRFKCALFKPIAIENNFFGPRITVSGLITAGDIINQVGLSLKDKNVLLPQTMLNSDALFLDDYNIEQLAQKLQANVQVLAVDGQAFIDVLVGGRR